uniref:Ovule protein n=1 Tax=Steinernema glaseri TaxID=37863 RepID=A0A1I7YRN0_9BILA
MFNGIYELLFGASVAEDDVPKENDGVPLAGKSADGWFLVDRCVHEKQQELKPKEKIAPQPSEEALKRAAEKAQALAEKKRIHEIESLLFEEPPVEEPTHRVGAEPILVKHRAPMKLTQPKMKRSKKSGKLSSNRSNDRKCNNIN